MILWNQRWEYDKGPEVFFRALSMLATEGVDFRLALLGKNQRRATPEFEMAQRRFGDRMVHFGYATEEQYRDVLHQADVVVSTAIHEFFGVAIVEAIHCGCFPLLPRRLSYPEVVRPAFHDACLYDGFEDLLERLRLVLTEPTRARDLAGQIRRTVARFDWEGVGPEYDEAMMEVVCKV
jgi:glycosyltransferase involved in cell wall biosynthesis